MNLRYPKKVRFECQRCAQCCGDSSHRGRNIMLLESEVRQISNTTGLRPLSFASRSLSIQPYRYRMKKRNGKCVFLDGKACRIYNIRPLICRVYPFSIKRGDNGYKFEVSEECPGIGIGKTLVPGEFERMLEEAQRLLQSS
ncbi:MAG: YkgJ family cysteine cluster protein [candidate division Zixibacteria bacterium]|nr:YkgJ family cysteine cluster protein [candidate division Zixibacteria bacterium]